MKFKTFNEKDFKDMTNSERIVFENFVRILAICNEYPEDDVRRMCCKAVAWVKSELKNSK